MSYPQFIPADDALPVVSDSPIILFVSELGAPLLVAVAGLVVGLLVSLLV